MCGTPGKTFADPIFMEHPDCLRLRFGQIDLLYSKQEMLLLDTHPKYQTLSGKLTWIELMVMARMSAIAHY